MNNIMNNIMNILKKYKIKINKNKITKNNYFIKIYDKMKNILKDILINDIKIIENNFDPSLYLNDNEFTSKNIKDIIIKELKYQYEIIFENNIIVYYSKNKIVNKCPKIIIDMFTIIKTLKILFNRDDISHHQKIIFYETLEKKKFPKKGTLGPNEINSGLTFVDLHKNGNIILYRKEELLKVLIHELIHSNLIDIEIILTKKSKEFNDFFCVNYKILLNEAYTETFATIINIFYINIINNLSKKDLDNMFFNEMKYSTYICSKIMKYYNISSVNDIIKLDNKCISIFPQKTNVFSYYILKNILLYNHISFGNILEKYNVYYKVNSEECINEIIKLIINNISSLDNRIIKNLNDNNNSLRLCLY
jgi:hypothetical protein